MLFALAMMIQTTSTDATVTAIEHRIGPAIAAWKECIMTSAEHYARTSKEPAETIADAALGHCQAEAAAIDHTMRFAGSPMTSDDVGRIEAGMPVTWRPRLIAHVLDVRAGASK